MDKNNQQDIVQNTTCFMSHKKYNVCCNKTQCKNWINSTNNCNCCINAVKNGPMALDEISKIFNLSRIRICQVEKETRNKIIKNII